MSGKNKVNPDHYKVAGRLSQDDLARARRTQSEPLFGATRSRQDKPLPPWMLKEQSTGQSAEDARAGAMEEGAATSTPARATAEPRPRQQAKSAKAAKAAKAAKTSTRRSKTATSTKAVKAKSPTARKTAKRRPTSSSKTAAKRRPTPTSRRPVASKSRSLRAAKSRKSKTTAKTKKKTR